MLLTVLKKSYTCIYFICQTKMDSEKKTPMDDAAKSRVMSSAGKETGGHYEKGGWPARGQAAADKNANASKGDSKGSKKEQGDILVVHNTTRRSVEHGTRALKALG